MIRSHEQEPPLEISGEPGLAAECTACGCTMNNPCITDGQPCQWVALGESFDGNSIAGLCSACVEKPLGELLDMLATPRDSGFDSRLC